jgi:hypothetical protein
MPGTTQGVAFHSELVATGTLLVQLNRTTHANRSFSRLGYGPNDSQLH